MQREVQTVHVHESLLAYAVTVVGATRAAPELSLGASPRATRDWVRAAQAAAYIAGRRFVVPDDLKGAAEPVLAHRLIVRDEAAADGAEAQDVLRRIIAAAPVPDGGRSR